MRAGRRIGKPDEILIAEFRPIMLVQAIRIEQPLVRRIFPFVAPAENRDDRDVLRDRFFFRRPADARLRRVRVRLGMKLREAMRGAEPDASFAIFKHAPRVGVGQSFIDAVLDPGVLGKTFHAAVGRDPDVSVVRAHYAVDLVKTRAHDRPVLAGKLPDGIRRGAPEFAGGGFHERSRRRGDDAVGKRLPLILVKANDAALAAKPEIAVLRFDERVVRAIGRQCGKRLEGGAVVFFEAAFLTGAVRGFDGDGAIAEYAESVLAFGGLGVNGPQRVRRARLELKKLLAVVEQQITILERQQEPDTLQIRAKVPGKIVFDIIPVLERMQRAAGDKPQARLGILRHARHERVERLQPARAFPERRAVTQQAFR